MANSIAEYFLHLARSRAAAQQHTHGSTDEKTAAMKEFGLDDAKIETVLAGDKAAISDAIQSELDIDPAADPGDLFKLEVPALFRLLPGRGRC